MLLTGRIGFAFATLAAVTAARADDKQIVARTFHANSEYLVMNLPPRPDAWPGAIFTANLRFPISHGDPNDPKLHRGQAVVIDSKDGFDLTGSLNGGASGWLGGSVEAGDVADVVMSFPDARIVDMDMGDLIRHVEASADAIAAAKRGQIPLLVVKAYSGTPTVTINRKLNASLEAWGKLRSNIKVGAGAAASTDDSVSYKGNGEIVFAFETSQIQFDPSDLNKGKITIQLSALPAQLYALRENDSSLKMAAAILATGGNVAFSDWNPSIIDSNGVYTQIDSVAGTMALSEAAGAVFKKDPGGKVRVSNNPWALSASGAIGVGVIRRSDGGAICKTMFGAC